MLINETRQTTLEIEMFNLIVAQQETAANCKKQLRSKRMSVARRAIEEYRETKQLAQYVDDSWFRDDLNVTHCKN